MAVLRWLLKLNHNFILTSFIAVVVVATFILLSSMAYMTVTPQNNLKFPHRVQDDKIQVYEARRNILNRIPDFSNQSQSILQSLSQRRLPTYKKPGPPPISALEEQQCREPHCAEYLSGTDSLRFKYCSDLANITREDIQKAKKRNCHFINHHHHHNHHHRAPVALVSLPGSGNTWIRGILETTTGVCTGAVYCDVSLRKSGFVGEYIQSGAALVVKTHERDPRAEVKGGNGGRELKSANTSFGAIIMIIRNPFNALVSEWNRKVANEFNTRTIVLDSHTKVAGEEWFGTNHEWSNYVRSQTMRWKAMIKNWFLFDHKTSKIVVTYESLKSDTLHEMERIFKFLNVQYDRNILEKKLNDKFGVFKRKQYPRGFIHYTDKQVQYILKVIVDIQNLLVAQRKSHLLNVNQYLNLDNMADILNGTKWSL